VNIVELFKEAEKPAKKYVSIIFFWLSTSRLPWAGFAAGSFPHLGRVCPGCGGGLAAGLARGGVSE